MKLSKRLLGISMLLAIAGCTKHPASEAMVVGSDSSTSTRTAINTVHDTGVLGSTRNTATNTSGASPSAPSASDNSGGRNSSNSSRSGGSSH